MEIQKAKEEDLQEILALQYLAYQREARLLNNPEIPPLKQSLSDIKKEFTKGTILKAVNEENQIIGSVRGYVENETLYVGKLMVHPKMEGQGIGSRLLKAIEEIGNQKRCELFTSSKSTRNIGIYERAGYQKFRQETITKNLEFIYLEKPTCRCTR